MRQMPIGDVLADYQDGNLRGWPREVALVWRNNPAGMAALCDDIAANGMRKPVHLGDDGRIWDGHHRIAAALALELDIIPVTDARDGGGARRPGQSADPRGNGHVIRRLLAAVGLRLVETNEESEVLTRLAACTGSREEYLRALNQAVIIAQLGGTTDEKLEALLALGTWRMMSPATEERLHAVGIDTRPWRVVEAEWKAGRR